MSMFTLAISCLTTSNLSLIHGPNILGSYAILFFTALNFTSISSHIHNWHCFCFDLASSFLLELFLHSSAVAYWAPTGLGSLSFSVLSFCIFILFMGFSRQEYWSRLLFPSPGAHIFVRTLHHDLSILGGSWSTGLLRAGHNWVSEYTYIVLSCSVMSDCLGPFGL